MSNPITDVRKTNLLFKQFMGVAATQIGGSFTTEGYSFVPNIFSKDVMIESIPDIPPETLSDLDGSANWLDSSSNYATNTVMQSTNTITGQTFAEMYPDSNLKFYKNLSLVPVSSASNGQVWGSFTDYSGSVITNKNSVLEHCIPFKYDDVDLGYVPVVKRNRNSTGAPAWTQENQASGNLYWLMDSGSGYVLFYAEKTVLEANNIKDIKVAGVQDKTKAPLITCFVYDGKLGITNLDVSGQVQVGDLSGALGNIGHIDRMVLPDGSANVLELNDEDAIRSQYNYVRKNMFIGYQQPIIDNSSVDHTQDPSLNNVVYELDVSGNSVLNGTLSVISNVDISGTLDVIEKTTLTDVSTNFITVNDNLDVSGNVDISGTLDVIGKTTLTDVSTNFVTVNDNLDVSGNVDILGHTRLTDVSATNVTISGILDVEGKTILTDISASNLSAGIVTNEYVS